jgi:hypothetical protein
MRLIDPAVPQSRTLRAFVLEALPTYLILARFRKTS